MKVKELIKVLEEMDGNLEVMTYHDEIGEYFNIDNDNIIREKVYYDKSCIISEELARELVAINRFDDFDENKIKEVLVIP